VTVILSTEMRDAIRRLASVTERTEAGMIRKLIGEAIVRRCGGAETPSTQDDPPRRKRPTAKHRRR